MTYTLYFIFDTTSGVLKRIDVEDARLLYTLSSISRGQLKARQHQIPLNAPREILTVHIGIPGNSGIIIPITVRKTVHHVVDRYWLVILNFMCDDAGTPSPLSPSSPPAIPMTHGLGLYKDMGPDAYRKHTHILYKSKRGRYYAAPLLPYRGLKASRGHFPPTVN